MEVLHYGSSVGAMWRWRAWRLSVARAWALPLAGYLFASAADPPAPTPAGPAEDVASPTPAADPGSLRPHKELMTAWLLLLLDSGATYGYELRRELDAHQLSIDPSILYRTLRKLERDGWVQSRWMRSVAGPRRRFYRLTPAGRRTLDEMASLIGTIRDFHDTFLSAHEQALGRRQAAGDADDAIPNADDAPPPPS